MKVDFSQNQPYPATMSLAQLRQQKKEEKIKNQETSEKVAAQQIVKAQKDNLEAVLTMIRADS